MVKQIFWYISLASEFSFSVFGYGCMLRRDASLVVCRVLCASVVGATSSEGFLVFGRTLATVPPGYCDSTK